MTVQLIQGDCLIEMDKLIEAGVKVSAIIGDLPYGTTACSWDEIIPFAPMWERVKKINKGVFVTTASQPFTSKIVMSNIENFKQDLVWDKVNHANFLLSKIEHLEVHESILIFCDGKTNYNPQMRKIAMSLFGKAGVSKSEHHPDIQPVDSEQKGFPKSIIRIPKPNNLSGGGLHPTQKPVALYEYLIRTYTNEGDTVLDFTCGSGTTGVACVNMNRNCILIDKDQHWIDVATKRVKDAEQQMRLF